VVQNNAKINRVLLKQPKSVHTILIVGWFMIFNATFNNISSISWLTVVLVAETGVPGENHLPVEGH
jgi:hypothetical protein